MGKKGDKLTSISNLAAEQLLVQLESINDLSAKKMFGGNGIFSNGKMFAMVDSKAQVYLKADETLAENYLKLGMSKHSRMPYFLVSDDVLDNKEQLISMAKKSINILT